ncbi:MAG: helix-turn-helix transcriptional regulator [Clostridia bacterium]|nr:helix-turn-helix transcriptional regulator [Clostridia bacterium]
MDYIALGHRIREYRTRLKITQEFLAEKLDLSAVYISQIENGARKPSLATVFRIARFLNVSMDDLFADSIKSQDIDRLYELTTMLSTRTDTEVEFVTAIVRAMLDHLKNNHI